MSSALKRRKKLLGSKEKRRVTFYIDEDMIDGLYNIAAEENLDDQSKAIRLCISRAIAEYELRTLRKKSG